MEGHLHSKSLVMGEKSNTLGKGTNNILACSRQVNLSNSFPRTGTNWHFLQSSCVRHSALYLCMHPYTHTYHIIKLKHFIKTYSTYAFTLLAAKVQKSKAKSNKNILRGSFAQKVVFCKVYRSYFKFGAPQVSFLLFSTDSCGCARTPTGPGELPAGVLPPLFN